MFPAATWRSGGAGSILLSKSRCDSLRALREMNVLFHFAYFTQRTLVEKRFPAATRRSGGAASILLSKSRCDSLRTLREMNLLFHF
jgi:hypothetical protein